MTDLIVCPGCGFASSPEEGSIHAYMLSSPACWRRFNAIMAREYGTPELMPTHFLAVDAFAAQHPGDPQDKRARQSVWIHLAALHAVLREGRKPDYRYHLLRRLADARDDWPAPPPHAPFPLVAGTIPSDLDAAEHILTMRQWAETTLSSFGKVNPDLSDRLERLG